MKTILILLITIFLGGCMFGKKVNRKVYSYGTEEFKNKVETANIKIVEAIRIMCEYKNLNNIKGLYSLYHIDGDNYVFKYGGFSKGLEYWVVKGTDGIYVNMKSSKLELIDKKDKNYEDIIISLKKFTFLPINCDNPLSVIEYKDKSNTFFNSIQYKN